MVFVGRYLDFHKCLPGAFYLQLASASCYLEHAGVVSGLVELRLIDLICDVEARYFSVVSCVCNYDSQCERILIELDRAVVCFYDIVSFALGIGPGIAVCQVVRVIEYRCHSVLVRQDLIE